MCKVSYIDRKGMIRGIDSHITGFEHLHFSNTLPQRLLCVFQLKAISHTLYFLNVLQLLSRINKIRLYVASQWPVK